VSEATLDRSSSETGIPEAVTALVGLGFIRNFCAERDRSSVKVLSCNATGFC